MLLKSENKTLINCRGKLLDLSEPKVMGIVNINPDSFYAESRVTQIKTLVHKVEQMLLDGADIIDLGAYSTRPGAGEVSQEVELERSKIIAELHKELPNAVLSIDTFRSQVAEQAVENGVSIVNDVSGGTLDENMFETVARLKTPYVLMHMRGTPQTMKSLTEYDDILHDINRYFSEKVQQLIDLGCNDIILDPGFGFAKTIAQNFYLLKHLEHFQVFGLPVLAGLSRKSMIYRTLKTDDEQALNGSTVLNTLALDNGAKILRVHDVAEAVEVVKLHRAYQMGID